MKIEMEINVAGMDYHAIRIAIQCAFAGTCGNPELTDYAAIHDVHKERRGYWKVKGSNIAECNQRNAMLSALPYGVREEIR